MHNNIALKREHLPVLLDAVIRGLKINPDGCYIDATFGRGGHSNGILAGLSDTGRLIAVDRDDAAITAARSLSELDARVQVQHANFSDLDRLQGVAAQSVDGILLDLGVSSPQLDQAERGFSFMHDGPLDMRMDQSREPSAAQYLNEVSEAELLRVLREYGEEPQAKKIAAAIIAARGSLTRTSHLANLVSDVKGRGKPGRHPATQVFQAIRMAVNAELEALQSGLSAAFNLLKIGGRICVISFHSLEDRMVKEFFNERAKAPAASRRDFMGANNFIASARLISKDKASDEECRVNPRSRSAVLRVAEKLL